MHNGKTDQVYKDKHNQKKKKRRENVSFSCAYVKHEYVHTGIFLRSTKGTVFIKVKNELDIAESILLCLA